MSSTSRFIPCLVRSRSAAPKLPVGRLGKIAQLDVAGPVGHHERGVHAGNPDLVAHHLDVDQLVVARRAGSTPAPGVPRGPRSFSTACSLVQPLASSPLIFAITSPRRMPFL